MNNKLVVAQYPDDDWEYVVSKPISEKVVGTWLLETYGKDILFYGLNDQRAWDEFNELEGFTNKGIVILHIDYSTVLGIYKCDFNFHLRIKKIELLSKEEKLMAIAISKRQLDQFKSKEGELHQ